MGQRSWKLAPLGIAPDSPNNRQAPSDPPEAPFARGICWQIRPHWSGMSQIPLGQFCVHHWKAAKDHASTRYAPVIGFSAGCEHVPEQNYRSTIPWRGCSQTNVVCIVVRTCEDHSNECGLGTVVGASCPRSGEWESAQEPFKQVQNLFEVSNLLTGSKRDTTREILHNVVDLCKKRMALLRKAEHEVFQKGFQLRR